MKLDQGWHVMVPRTRVTHELGLRAENLKELDQIEIGAAFSVRIFTGIWDELKQVCKPQTHVKGEGKKEEVIKPLKWHPEAVCTRLSFFIPAFPAGTMFFFFFKPTTTPLSFSDPFLHERSTNYPGLEDTTPNFSGSWRP